MKKKTDKKQKLTFTAPDVKQLTHQDLHQVVGGGKHIGNTKYNDV